MTKYPKMYGVIEEYSKGKFAVDWLIEDEDEVGIYVAWYDKSELVSLGELEDIKERDLELYNKLKAEIK